ncbi:hypothetical protein GFGA_1d0720 [Gluconobacter frateurii NBRC 103465]|nr:hypothetical protein GFGA_1d0720 [Gluconobacter frateurii NBRC 103465]
MTVRTLLSMNFYHAYTWSQVISIFIMVEVQLAQPGIRRGYWLLRKKISSCSGDELLAVVAIRIAGREYRKSMKQEKAISLVRWRTLSHAKPVALVGRRAAARMPTTISFCYVLLAIPRLTSRRRAASQLSCC